MNDGVSKPAPSTFLPIDTRDHAPTNPVPTHLHPTTVLRFHKHCPTTQPTMFGRQRRNLTSNTAAGHWNIVLRHLAYVM